MNKLPTYSPKCRCPSCGEYFRKPYAFDRHRVGRFRQLTDPPGASDRRCLTGAEMQAKGMMMDSDGYWMNANSQKLCTRTGGDLKKAVSRAA